MADPKYIKHVVPLSPQVAEGVTRVRVELTAQLGFTPSLAEVIAYLVNYYEKRERASEQLSLI